jgi:hypothetical protein
LVARIGRRFSEALRLDLYAGAALDGGLRVKDANGIERYDQNRDPAALFRLSLVGSFLSFERAPATASVHP